MEPGKKLGTYHTSCLGVAFQIHAGQACFHGMRLAEAILVTESR